MNFSELINHRYSARGFKNTKIDRATLEMVLEAGRIAPTAANRQPFKFIVADEDELLQKIYPAYERDWFKTSPAVIIVCGHHEKSWTRSYDGKDFCDVDCAIAIDHMTLMAAEQNLGTCWICHFKPELIASLFNLPNNWEPIALLPIGYPMQEKPTPKKRKELSELVCWNKFE